MPRLGPGVVVAGLAAHVQHAVDRTRTAQHLAARDREAPVAGARLGLRVEAPVDAWAVDQLPETDRHMDEGMPVAAAGFEKQHAVARVRAQPVGQHAAGGAGAHHDVVETRPSQPPALPIPQGTSGRRDRPAAAYEVNVLRAHPRGFRPRRIGRYWARSSGAATRRRGCSGVRGVQWSSVGEPSLGGESVHLGGMAAASAPQEVV